MFGEESRIPSEIIVGRPPESESISSFAFSNAKQLSKSFEGVRENNSQAQKRSKDYYDLGAVQIIFKIGDMVRVKVKTLPGTWPPN